MTCIPSKSGQKELINILKNKLAPNGLLYISDYYLQDNRSEVKEYKNLDEDTNNYGVFTLPEGAAFRHHTREWIMELQEEFKLVSEKIVDVKTMNGHTAKAFQIVAKI